MRARGSGRAFGALLVVLLVLILAYLYTTSIQPSLPSATVRVVITGRGTTTSSLVQNGEENNVERTTTSASTVTVTVVYTLPWTNGTEDNTTEAVSLVGASTSKVSASRESSVPSGASNRGYGTRDRPQNGVVQVEIDADRLVIKAKGGISTVGFYREDDVFPYASVGLRPGLTSLFGGKFVDPLYVRVSRKATILVAPLSKLLNGSEAYVVVWAGEDSIAKFKVRRTSSGYKILDFRVTGTPVDTCAMLKEEGYDMLYALVCGINETSIAAIRKILGSLIRGPSGNTIWGILAWEESNIKYNSSVEGVETPLELIKTRQGKCIDYAVFTVAALFAAGFSEAYIVEIEDLIGHAFAAVPYNGTLVVLDQRRPAAELADYMEYMLDADNATRIYYYRIRWTNDGVVVETGVDIKPRRVRDLWPLDRLPSNIVSGVAKELVGLLGAKLDRRAAREYRIAFDIFLCNCKIKMIPLPCLACEVALGKLYSPIFAKQWEKYIAEEIYKQLLKEGVEKGEYTSVWLEFGGESDTRDRFVVYLS